ncbi:MAG: rhodanese-like domain-containing protein [Myxococcales bacterium]|nr:rhodanese-like domain-containing protein [Myxococcales bacterium]
MWFVLLAVACGAPPEPATHTVATAPAPASKRSDTDIEGLAAAMEKGVKVIDVRTPEEFAAGHVPGAVNVPLGSFEAKSSDPALAGIDPDVPTYVICQSGGRSARAADQLAAGGYAAVNVKGGTGAWIAAGKPVEQ